MIKLECDESYDQGLPNHDDSASENPVNESKAPPPGFPYGKNGKPRIVPLAPQPSPQLESKRQSPNPDLNQNA